MMTLDEAIHHAEEVAESCQLKAYDIERNDYKDLEECAEEHRQLGEWLRELKHLRCVNDKILEFLEGFESDHPCEMMSGKNDWCEINCNYAFPTKECWLHYANMILESEKE